MAITPVTSSPIRGLQEVATPQKPSASGSARQVTQNFGEMLSSLNQSQANSDALVEKLSRGENVDLHTVMIGMEENNVKFNVALGIRDRLVEAYREVMRMQV
jgi:flagellar hook-basal body complex protein FliE